VVFVFESEIKVWHKVDFAPHLIFLRFATHL